MQIPGLRHTACSEAEAIFRAGLARVDPVAMLGRILSLEGSVLRVRTELEEASYDLGRYDRVLVAGMGKAAARMALGLEAVLGDRIWGGVIAVKEGYTEELKHLRLLESAHPTPDRRSLAAATELLGLSALADERSLVIVLVSGGASSIVCAPAEGLDLEDKAETTRLLLASGAAIGEVNCVRKHLSGVKGGRLAAAYAPATVLSLVLSDVVGDDLGAIASGPTVADPSSWSDALAVVRRHGLEDRLPERVASTLRRGAAGALPDTPKPGDPSLARTRTLLIGGNGLALMAARARAEELGYETRVWEEGLVGEARAAGAALCDAGIAAAAQRGPGARSLCLLAGGETTVTLRGGGRGGRNQEMALAFLCALERAFPGARAGTAEAANRICLLAASTDGSDGPTDAAGAFASSRILAEAAKAGLDPRAFLEDNDSWSFFEATGGLLKTGPTNTNVCDLQILLLR